MDLKKIYHDLVADIDSTVVEINQPLTVKGQPAPFSEEDLFSLVLEISSQGMERMAEIREEARMSGQRLPDQSDALLTIVLMAVLTGMVIERETTKEKQDADS